MAKDFSDFVKYTKTLNAQKIQDSIIDELNEYAEQNNIPDEDFFLWHIRSFNYKLTMKMLEEYHNWLNS